MNNLFLRCRRQVLQKAITTATLQATAFALLICAASELSGCAKVNETGLGIVTTKVDAFAIVNDQLLSGTVALVPDRTGRVVLSAENGPVTACGGPLRYTGTLTGDIDLHCNNGSNFLLRFTLMSETRGYAYGKSGEGSTNTPPSLTFGLSEEEAPAYLTAPAGRKLLVRDEGGLEIK